MDLTEVQKHWNHLGSTDPLWAILTEPSKRYGGWNQGEFFASGVAWIDALMQEVEDLGLAIPRRRALDFGCGVGRLTQALGRHFERCVGVDIAPSMIEQARRFNQWGDRCEYVLNAADNLAVFADESFDLINSYIVLQHIEPRYIESYLREFVRILAPGGLIHVQIPAERVFLSIDPLPDSAFRAGLSLLDAPGPLGADSDAVVQVQVENLSPVAWPAHGSAAVERPIHLGNHWLDLDGRLIQGDDGRSVFPQTLPPGGSVTLPLGIHTPRLPGAYLLEIDLVQEGVAWFAARGSSTLRLPITVQRGPRDLAAAVRRWFRDRQSGASSGDKAFQPIMEMYVLPEERVRSVVESEGGHVHFVRHWPGGDYRHATYFLTKPRGAGPAQYLSQ